MYSCHRSDAACSTSIQGVASVPATRASSLAHPGEGVVNDSFSGLSRRLPLASLATSVTLYLVPAARPCALLNEDLELITIGFPPPMAGTSVNVYCRAPATTVLVSKASFGPSGMPSTRSTPDRGGGGGVFAGVGGGGLHGGGRR